jgi:aldehyde dehydrogenase (NAD+)
LTSAIAAGNRVILKPSERIPETGALLRRLVHRAVGDEWCVVIEGDAEVGRHLLSKPFDHFFFTGSPEVGRKVMEAAAGHFSSVTLELGGKSPAIIDPTADLEMAADKIIVGKFMNAGQTCIAPDYVMTHVSRFDAAVDHLRRAVARIHEVHQDRITGLVDDRHAERLTELWNEAHQIGATKNDGEVLDLDTVSVITKVSQRSRLMNEEIFGPLLPVVHYESIEDILGLVRLTGSPLTTYLFTRDPKFAEQIERRLPTGSLCRDETLLHFAHPELPFGGVGKSGTGRTHGRFGFQAFSNDVSVLRSRRSLSVLPLLFPVRGSREKRVRNWLMKWLES